MKPRLRKAGYSQRSARAIPRDKRKKHCRGRLLIFFLVLFLTAPAVIVFLHSLVSKKETGSLEKSAQFTSESRLKELEATESELRGVVSAMKRKKVVMETDSAALEAISKLQQATQELLVARYGETKNGKYLVEMEVRFPSMMPDATKDTPSTGVILIETAPIELMPHAVYLFLEIVRSWKKGAFHRNAGHVLQTMVTFGRKDFKRLAFQEYSKDYPHVKGTLGFAGRPGGGAFYISTVDNTRNHGPGSQGSKTEADSCFGRVIEGHDVVERLSKVWGVGSSFTRSKMGFLDKNSQHAIITSIKIVPS